MTAADQAHWDTRYTEQPGAHPPALPAHFQEFAEQFAVAESAIEIACGRGRTAVWLAQQGVAVTAYDVSPVAIAQARELAEQHGVVDRCCFAVADLDDGLPDGPHVDLVVCNMFRDPSLDDSLIARVRPGGVLAIAALSEVGADPGRFRVKRDELQHAFAALDLVAEGQADGLAWLVATRQ